MLWKSGEPNQWLQWNISKQNIIILGTREPRKKPGYLLYMRDYTTQLYACYHKPL